MRGERQRLRRGRRSWCRWVSASGHEQVASTAKALVDEAALGAEHSLLENLLLFTDTRAGWTKDAAADLGVLEEGMSDIDRVFTFNPLTRYAHQSLGVSDAKMYLEASAVDDVPGNRWSNYSVIAALRAAGIVAPMVVPGAIDGQAMLQWVNRCLVPELKPDDVMIRDNLSVHGDERLRTAIELCGAVLAFVPAYSLDLNPIEQAWTKIKAIVRKLTPRCWKSCFPLFPKPCKPSPASTTPGNVVWPATTLSHRRVSPDKNVVGIRPALRSPACAH